MKRITYVSLAFGLVGMMATGCATTNRPIALAPDTAAKIRTVAIVDEINTPTSLSVPSAAGAGLLVAAVVDPKKQNAFTSEVRANLDFQKFAAEAMRQSFEKALKNKAGWTVAPPTEKADAALVLSVDRMGVMRPKQFWPPPSHLDYTPVVSISATLIANAPLEIVRTDGEVQALDAASHPILFRGTADATAADNVACHKSREYSGNPDIFKAAFGKAIDLAVKRITDTWTSGAAVR